VIHDPQGPYTLRTTPTVRRAVAETLTEAVAAAAYEFITGPLLEEPHRVGKRLLPPLVSREREILTSGYGSRTMVHAVDCECGGSAARS
jgi:hypothetical protein